MDASLPLGAVHPHGQLAVKLEHFLRFERDARALWAALLTAAAWWLRRLRALVAALLRKVHASPRFWRRFAKNLLLGVCIEVVVMLGGSTAPVTALENAALDLVMRLNQNTEKSDGRPVQLFIDVDERTWRSPVWGGGEPKATPWERVADLIEKAASLGTRYILVDFLIEGAWDHEQEKFFQRMEDILKNHPCKTEEPADGHSCQHFLFVRSLRQPLNDATLAAQGIRTAYAVDKLMARHPERVFAVVPNFGLTDGQVLRRWRLWESACTPLPWGAPGEGVWAVVPSPQLMIEMLEKQRGGKSDWDIPWRLRFARDAVSAAPVTPAELDAGRRCVTDASGALHEAGYSARLADWQAGKWVQAHFPTCYQQGFFTVNDCKSGSAPAPVLMQSETDAARAGGHLANRVLFRQSIEDGEVLTRVVAVELLAGEQSRPNAAACEQKNVSADDLKKFCAAAEQGALTVAVIGASYKMSRDLHLTPLGLMPGALVLVNAVDSLHSVGVLQSPGGWDSARVLQSLGGWAGLTITMATLAASALFACLSHVWCRVFMLALVALVLWPLSLELIRHGVWLNLAAPVLGIYLDRELSIFMESRKHHQEEST